MITTLNKIFNINLLEVFGLSDVTEEDKKRFFDDVSSWVMSRVILNLKKDLSEDAQVEFARLFEQDAPEDVRTKFLETYAPDMEERILREALIFKSEMKRIASGNAGEKTAVSAQ